MSETLIDLVFGAQTLNDPALIEKFPESSADHQATDLFAMGRDHSDSMKGDVASWFEVALSRAPAPATGKRSPAIALEGVDADRKTCVIADFRVSSQPLPLDEITSQVAGRNFLMAEGREKRKRLQIAKELMAWMALKGAVTVNGTTIPGSNVSFSFTQAVTSLSPAASWANPATKLASAELDRYGSAYYDANGLELRRMVVDNNVHKYARQNTEVMAISSANTNPDKSGTVMGPSAKSFDFEGLRWDVTRAKYDLSGTLTKYLGADGLIALPADEELPNVLGRAEGYGCIPREAIGSEALAGQNYQAPGRGFYSFAYTIPNPAAVVVIYGWRGLFFLTFPEAVGYDDSVITP